jgi:hypothetical protein
LRRAASSGIASLQRPAAAAGALGLLAAAAGAAGPPSLSSDLFPHQRGRRVVFSIEAPAEASVYLVGDFNDWQAGTTPLDYVGDGLWEVGLELPEGVYEYKFIVDGRHRLDPSNPEEVSAPDGSIRSRVRVREDGRVSHYETWHPRRDRMPTQVTFEPREHSRITFGGDYSYQRVDGSVLWLRARYASSYEYVPEVEVRFGYGWVSERGTTEVDFRQPLWPDKALSLGALYTHGTGYENQSGIGWRENTLAALFFRHDFNDYYKIVGIEPYLRLRLPGAAVLRFSYGVEDYGNLTTQTDWSFFTAGLERFRENPLLFRLDDAAITGEGVLRALRFDLVHDTRRARNVGTVGSFVHGFLELGDGDFSYARWVGDGRAYMRLGPPVHLALRAAAAGRFGNEAIPSQKLFYLGGLGTVRGHSFRSVYGDRALLTSLEYTLLFGDLDYGAFFFYDAGTAWKSTAPYDERLEDTAWLQSVGVGLKTTDDDFQLLFAKPVGAVQGDWETTVRLERTF